MMTAVLGTNIVSPLGRTSQENYDAVKRGRSALTGLEKGWNGIPEEITASVFGISGDTDSKRGRRFEDIVVESIAAALEGTGVNPSSERTVLIISTTKGDIESLVPDTLSRYSGPAGAVHRIARHFGIVTSPVIVCNACISGGNAQLLAARFIGAGIYDNAIVCGADTVSPFTAAGFLSFKALSPFECRPFDMERRGLNLGEAAATIVFGRVPDRSSGLWVLEDGAQTNDAYHVSAPSPDGNGVCRAIASVMEGVSPEDLDCISLHGTATLFNDQMESRAIQDSGLSDIPAMALKGYYGHTLGASGVLETIITMKALENGTVLPTRGFEEPGVSGRVSVSAVGRPSGGKGRFLKILSGFGGCNCALRYGRAENALPLATDCGHIEVLGDIRMESPYDFDGTYKTSLENNPKYYKMDMLAKLSYVASELLLKRFPSIRPTSVILFNGSSSIVQDRKHVGMVMGNGGFFPSPSVFLYTLPNLAVGELAIRNGIKGETALYILQKKDPGLMDDIIRVSLPKGTVALTGWVDCRAEDDFEVDLKLITIN